MLTENILRRRKDPVRQAVIVTDAVLNVTFMNASAEALLGYRSASGGDATGAPNLPLNLTIQSATSPTCFNGEIEDATGSMIPVSVHVTTIPDGCGVSGFIFRITTRIESVSDLWRF